MSAIPSLYTAGAIQSAELGINRGLAGLNRDAATIATISTGIAPDQNLTAPLVDAAQQKLYVEASAKALSLVDEAMNSVLGRLVDTKA